MNTLKPIQTDRVFNLPMKEAWEIVTSQKFLTEWLMPGSFKPEVGHHYHFQCFPPDKSWDGKIFGEILEVDKPNMVKFTWKTSQLNVPTTVCFQLEETEAGVRFSVTHTDFGSQDIIEYEKYVHGWEHHLDLSEKISKNEKA